MKNLGTFTIKIVQTAQNVNRQHILQTGNVCSVNNPIPTEVVYRNHPEETTHSHQITSALLYFMSVFDPSLPIFI